MISLEQKSCETENSFFLMTKLKLEMWFVWRYTGSEWFWIMVPWLLHLSSGCPHLPVLISLVSSSRKEFITTSCLGNKHIGGEKVLSVPLRPWWGAQWGERVEKVESVLWGDKGRLQKEDGIWVATKQHQDFCMLSVPGGQACHRKDTAAIIFSSLLYGSWLLSSCCPLRLVHNVPVVYSIWHFPSSYSHRTMIYRLKFTLRWTLGHTVWFLNDSE